MISVVIVVLVGAVLFRAFPCHCRRTVIPYFFDIHEKVSLMVAYAVLETFVAIGSTVTLDWFGAILWSLVATWCWMRVWKHEKGRIKRFASKLAGRVTRNAHGRLIVVHGDVE